MKRTLIATAVLATAITLGGCGGGSNQTLPPASDTPSSPTTPAAPTSTAPAWQAKYTPAQLKAYNAALKRLGEYTAKSNQIYAEGVDTPGAEQVFKDYTAIAPSLINELKTDFEATGIKVVVPPKVLWSRPTVVKGKDNVTIEQCNDFTTEKLEQNGKPRSVDIKVPRALLQIVMSKPKGYDWLIYSIKQTKTPCTASE